MLVEAGLARAVDVGLLSHAGQRDQARLASPRREAQPTRDLGAVKLSLDFLSTRTVGELNIAGLPAVTVPAGYYASGAPFGLLFVGPLWSEAVLLALAHDYENATRHRKPPRLCGS